MTAPATPISAYLAAPNRAVSAENGIDYAYREVGEGTPVLVLLQHFRGNLDNWDPALVDALAHTPASRDIRQRRGGRIDGRDAEHDHADGARCHRVPRGPRARRGRPPRLLDRQLRRPGDRADPAGGGPSPGARVGGPARRQRDARLGTR